MLLDTLKAGLGVVALLGATLSMDPAEANPAGGNPAVGQSSSAQPASSTAETNEKHSGTSATDALTENAPERPNAIAEARRAASQRASQEAAAGRLVPSAKIAPEPIVAPVRPMVQAVPPGTPQKNLTGDEFGFIYVGSTEKEMLKVLGPPSSRVVVLDDDGHLRESLQYWVKGNPMGTVRLDNGRVVQIETKGK
jgi:hypothetical protein